MSDAAQRQFGTGVLSRAAALVYSLLAVEAMLVLTTLPGLIPLILLDRDASNIPLVAACALPVGPALSAALYSLHQHRADLTDLRPVALFWRGYRTNLAGVLRIWIPWLAWLTIVAVNLAHFEAAAIPVWWAGLLVLIAVAVTLWLINALVITALFDFRALDVAKLAVYFLGHTRGVTLGNVSLLVVTAGVTVLFSEAVLTLLASVLVLVLLRNARPMIRKIQTEFTA